MVGAAPPPPPTSWNKNKTRAENAGGTGERTANTQATRGDQYGGKETNLGKRGAGRTINTRQGVGQYGGNGKLPVLCGWSRLAPPSPFRRLTNLPKSRNLEREPNHVGGTGNPTTFSKRENHPDDEALGNRTKCTRRTRGDSGRLVSLSYSLTS